MSQNDYSSDEAFEKKMKDLTPPTDNSTELQARFAEMRQRALGEMPVPQPRHRKAPWLIGGMATASLIVAVLSFNIDVNKNAVDEESDYVISSLDLLDDDADSEMLEEDLEFYVWLELVDEPNEKG